MDTKSMNIKAINSPECPDWMKRFNPTDIKWLNPDQTAALCVLNDSRYRLRLIWTKDKTAEGTNYIEIASTQEKGTDLEKIKRAFDGFSPEEAKSRTFAEVVEDIRYKMKLMVTC